MKINRWGFKNINSFGNKDQQIVISDKPELILIKGKNGHGKTTIANALTFSLYGKNTKRKIKDLPNRINKNLQTYVEFITKDGNHIELSRGISPNYFDLKYNNEIMNIADKSKLDLFVENELINIPFDVFPNTILLSINDFKSFINMKKEDKRKIVNKIFPMESIDSMHEILKLDLKQYNETKNQILFTIDNQNSLLNTYNLKLVELKEELAKLDQEKIKILESELISLNENKNNNLIIVNTNKLKIQKLTDAHTKYIKKIDTDYTKLINDKNTELNLKLSEYQTNINNIKTVISNKYSNTINAAKIDKENKLNELTIKESEVLNTLNISINNKISDLDTNYTTNLNNISDTYNVEFSELSNTLESKKQNKLNIDKQLNDIILNDHSYNTNITIINNKLDLYSKGICPHCDSKLNDANHLQHIEQLKSELNTYTNGINSNKLNTDKLNAELNSLIVVITNLTKQLSDLNEKFNITKTELSSNLNNNKNQLFTLKQNKLDELKKLLDNKKIEIDTLFNDEMLKIQSEIDIEIQNESIKYTNEFNEYKANIENKISILNNNRHALISKSESAYFLFLNSLNDIVNTYTNTNNEISINYNIKNNELVVLKQHGSGLDTIKATESLITDLNNQLIDLNTQIVNTNKEIDKITITKQLFEDNGLKRSILNKFLPIFNKTIEKLVMELEYQFSFKFDDNFDPCITHMGQEIDSNTLSSGEEKMMDIIVILAVFELIRYRQPDINIMFFDEIYNTLDAENINKVTAILKRYTQEYNITIFLISHTGVPMQYFDKTIEIVKDGLFSDLTIN